MSCYYGSILVVGNPVTQWVKSCWSSCLGVKSGWELADIFPTVYGLPLHIDINYHYHTILICLKYCWKQHKIASFSSISTGSYHDGLLNIKRNWFQKLQTRLVGNRTYCLVIGKRSRFHIAEWLYSVSFAYLSFRCLILPWIKSFTITGWPDSDLNPWPALSPTFSYCLTTVFSGVTHKPSCCGGFILLREMQKYGWVACNFTSFSTVFQTLSAWY